MSQVRKSTSVEDFEVVEAGPCTVVQGCEQPHAFLRLSGAVNGLACMAHIALAGIEGVEATILTSRAEGARAEWKREQREHCETAGHLWLPAGASCIWCGTGR